MLTSGANTVEVAGLDFGWPTGPSVLRLKNFKVRFGERVLMIGPSGSGKSTLLNLICGLIKPNAGTLKVLEQDLPAMGEVERDQFRATHIGVISQTLNVLPYLSVIDNVALACSFSKPRADAAVKIHGGVKAAAQHILGRLSIGDDLLSRPARFLSVGQQQRVAAARALIGSPALIVADEPTSALDSNARDEFMSLILDSAETSAISMLFVSHDSALEKYFNRVVELPSLNKPDEFLETAGELT